MLSAIQATVSSLPWRSLIVVEPEAELTVVEQYLSTDNDLEAYFNPVAELFVGEGRRFAICAHRTSPSAVGFSAASVPRSSVTPPCTGSASVSVRVRASSVWRPTFRVGAPTGV